MRKYHNVGLVLQFSSKLLILIFLLHISQVTYAGTRLFGRTSVGVSDPYQYSYIKNLLGLQFQFPSSKAFCGLNAHLGWEWSSLKPRFIFAPGYLTRIGFGSYVIGLHSHLYFMIRPELGSRYNPTIEDVNGIYTLEIMTTA